MVSTRQPLRKSARKSKVAIAERKSKKEVRHTITITESTIVTVGNAQNEKKVELSFTTNPPEVAEVTGTEKKKKKEKPE